MSSPNRGLGPTLYELMGRLQRYAVFSVSVILSMFGFENKIIFLGLKIMDQCW